MRATSGWTNCWPADRPAPDAVHDMSPRRKIVGVRIRVLGGFGVDGVAERNLGRRKARTRLKVLALARGGPVSVDALADVPWGAHVPARPADQVGVLVSRLRGVLGADRLLRSDAGYAVVTDWLDVDEVADLAARAAEAPQDGTLAVADDLDSAVRRTGQVGARFSPACSQRAGMGAAVVGPRRGGGRGQCPCLGGEQWQARASTRAHGGGPLRRHARPGRRLPATG